MPDYAGPLQRIVLSRTLWIIVALPLLGCAWHLVRNRRSALRAVRPEDVRRALLSAHRVGVASVALATEAALLFWGLGGQWQGDEYVRDRTPRFAAVHLGDWTQVEPPRLTEQLSGGTGSLTLTSLPGALVFLDDARLPTMRAPFVAAPVAAGAHALRIHVGDATSDAPIGPLYVAPGENLAIIP